MPSRAHYKQSSPWPPYLRGGDSSFHPDEPQQGTFVCARWRGVKDIGIILGFCETYRRPEASLMRQGTAVAVLVESHPVFGLLRCFLGLRPKPRHFSPYANGTIGTAQREGDFERAWHLRQAGRGHWLPPQGQFWNPAYCAKQSQFGTGRSEGKCFTEKRLRRIRHADGLRRTKPIPG